jgi:hypothetical protein
VARTLVVAAHVVDAETSVFGGDPAVAVHGRVVVDDRFDRGVLGGGAQAPVARTDCRASPLSIHVVDTCRSISTA